MEIYKELKQKQHNIEKALSKLSLVDRMLIMNYINQESSKVMDEIAYEMDRCIQAELILQFPDKSFDEIVVIADSIADLRAEQDRKITQWKKRYNGRTLEEEVQNMSEKLTKRIEQLVKANAPQNVAIKTLAKEFPDFPKVTIVNHYKKAKDELKAKQREEDVEVKPETTEALSDYILDNNTHKGELNNPNFRSDIKVKVTEFTVETDTVVYRFKDGLIDGTKSIESLVATMEKNISEYTEKIRDFTKAIEENQYRLNELEDIQEELKKKGVL